MPYDPVTGKWYSIPGPRQDPLPGAVIGDVLAGMGEAIAGVPERGGLVGIWDEANQKYDAAVGDWFKKLPGRVAGSIGEFLVGAPPAVVSTVEATPPTSAGTQAAPVGAALEATSSPEKPKGKHGGRVFTVPGVDYTTHPGPPPSLEELPVEEDLARQEDLLGRYSGLAPDPVRSLTESEIKQAGAGAALSAFGQTFSGKGTAGRALAAAAGALTTQMHNLTQEDRRLDAAHAEAVRQHELGRLQLESDFAKHNQTIRDKNAQIRLQTKLNEYNYDVQRWHDSNPQINTSGNQAIIVQPNLRGENEIEVVDFAPLDTMVDRAVKMAKLMEAQGGTSKMEIVNAIGDTVGLETVRPGFQGLALAISETMLGLTAPSVYAKALEASKLDYLHSYMNTMGWDVDNQDHVKDAWHDLQSTVFADDKIEDVLWGDIYRRVRGAYLSDENLYKKYATVPMISPFMQDLLYGGPE